MESGFVAATGEHSAVASGERWSGALATTSSTNATARPTGARRQPARREHRTPHRVPCRLTVYDLETGQPTTMSAQTVNISANGFAVQVGRYLPPGMWVEALVPHAGSGPMFVCGTVAHSRRVLAETYEIGVEFVHQTVPSVF